MPTLPSTSVRIRYTGYLPLLTDNGPIEPITKRHSKSLGRKQAGNRSLTGLCDVHHTQRHVRKRDANVRVKNQKSLKMQNMTAVGFTALFMLFGNSSARSPRFGEGWSSILGLGVWDNHLMSLGLL